MDTKHTAETVIEFTKKGYTERILGTTKKEINGQEKKIENGGMK